MRTTEIDFLVGRDVEEIRYAAPGHLRIIFDRGERAVPALYCDLGPSEYDNESSGFQRPIDPREPETVAAILGVVGKRVTSVGTSGGCLQLVFSDATELRCPPSEHYEAWEVVGGSPEHLVVCLPGGELAVYDERTQVQRVRFPT